MSSVERRAMSRSREEMYSTTRIIMKWKNSSAYPPCAKRQCAAMPHNSCHNLDSEDDTEEVNDTCLLKLISL